jgi:vancomycin resistance protein VanW
MPKPKKRSKIRLLVGSIYFNVHKQLYWHFSKNFFATTISQKPLEYLVFTHKTPLLRKLRKVDMQLQYNKITNLQIALKNLDGLILPPGEIFSYWKLIGKPTRSKGYLPGMILSEGRVQAGIGGGLCQLSNLLYWMTLHTPLKVIERWRHSYDVFPDSNRSQPFGSGATCAYPNIDLQIKNETRQQFQLKLSLTPDYLVGEIRSSHPPKTEYEIFEKSHQIKEAFGNYLRHNEIHRKVLDKETHQLIATEFVTENNAFMMYNPLLESSR